jgi:hypothetical protein
MAMTGFLVLKIFSNLPGMPLRLPLIELWIFPPELVTEGLRPRKLRG